MRFELRSSPNGQLVEEAARAIPLCYLTPTPYGGFALMLWTDSSPRVVPLPQFTTENLGHRAELLRSTLRSVDSYRAEAALAVRSCCEWLWANGLNRIHDALLMAEIDEVAIFSGGPLVGLPLHAATNSTNHYFIDDIAVTYAPSARTLLGPAASGALSTTRGRILIVDEPKPVSGEPLRLSAVETRTIGDIARHAGLEPIVLSHEAATKDAILTELRGADAFHFSGHALAEPGSPEMSRLEVAPSARITVADLRVFELKEGFLVTLSACESAVVGRPLPEEAIGLPGSLLEAGAAGVLGTLWEVRDSPSASYMLAAFYTNWMVKNMPPHRAMAAAVRWIRASDRSTLVKRFPTIEPGLSSSAAALRFVQDRMAAPDEWCAFIYNGL